MKERFCHKVPLPGFRIKTVLTVLYIDASQTGYWMHLRKQEGQDHAAHFIIRYFEVFKHSFRRNSPILLPDHCRQSLLFLSFLFLWQAAAFLALSFYPLCFCYGCQAVLLFSPLCRRIFVFHTQLVIGIFRLSLCLILFLSGFGGSGFTLLSEETGLFCQQDGLILFGRFSFGGTAGLSSTAPSSTSNMASISMVISENVSMSAAMGTVALSGRFPFFLGDSQFFGSGFWLLLFPPGDFFPPVFGSSGNFSFTSV